MKGKIRWRKWAAVGVLGAVAAVPLAWLSVMVPYFYANHLADKWQPAHPRTKAELERHLNLYVERVIEPKTSMWGNDYVLKPGERMVQYAILLTAPLDVVYDSEDRIQRIYTSYE